ncbi:hypothetical protein [Cupriavidus pauculus]|uniref:hypothetical protein n=1 Tax=Cupriavidus pauculus TaxID=82633 RepID=UPI001D0CA14D|nr:hypothetical protein [Cupriavidus pauculus]
MTAAICDIHFEQGIAKQLDLKDWLDDNKQPIPLDGCTAVLQVRQQIESTDTLLELTTENGKITIANNIVSMVFEVEDTAKLVPLQPRKVAGGLPDVAPQYAAGVYELRVTPPNGKPVSVLRGVVLITPAVVRP